MKKNPKVYLVVINGKSELLTYEEVKDLPEGKIINGVFYPSSKIQKSQ